MKNIDLAQRVQDILSETPKLIHKCIEDGDEAKAFRVLSDYANQRVIEELERMEKECDINYLDGIEGWKITRRIKELKQ